MAVSRALKRASQALRFAFVSLLPLLILIRQFGREATLTTNVHSATQICKDKFIFLYEVPLVFTSDLLSENGFELLPGTKYAQWQSEYFLHQILKGHPCTTKNPEEAKIFYVPIYGSGMGVVGPNGRMHIKNSLINWLKLQKSVSSNVSYFDRKYGRDHVMTFGASRSWCKASQPRQRVPKCLGFSQSELLDSNMIKLSVEFTGLQVRHFMDRKQQQKLSRIIIIPYMQHDVERAFGHQFFHESLQVPSTMLGRRKLLLAFSGSTLSKTAPFRAIFKSECDANIDCLFFDIGNSRQVVQTEDMRQLYRVSTYCAILGGDTRASKRIFDAIKDLCIPVIFDPLLALPFAADIPYEEMTISAPFIDSRSVLRSVIVKLRQIPESKVCSMQKLLLKYRSYFSYLGKERPNAVDMIIKRLLDYGNVLHEEKSDSVLQTGYLDWSKLQNRIIRKSSKGANKSIIESSLIRTQKIV